MKTTKEDLGKKTDKKIQYRGGDGDFFGQKKTKSTAGFLGGGGRKRGGGGS